MNGVLTHNYSGDSTVERVPYDHDHDAPYFLEAEPLLLNYKSILVKCIWNLSGIIFLNFKNYYLNLVRN
jgi:hypothetical protein